MRNRIGRRMVAASVVMVIALVLLALIGLAPARAAVGIQASSKPDSAATCEACHGTNGITPNPNIPNLAGQKAEYLVTQLKAFKSKTRKNDLMEAIAAQLSEADMRDIAKYWNSRPAVPVEGQPTGVLPIHSRMTFTSNFK
jgi:cytochrome c553